MCVCVCVCVCAFAVASCGFFRKGGLFLRLKSCAPSNYGDLFDNAGRVGSLSRIGFGGRRGVSISQEGGVGRWVGGRLGGVCV